MFARIARPLRAALVVLGIAAAALGAAQPAQASTATTVYGDFTITAPGGWANVSVGGFLDGMVYLQPSAPSYLTSNIWVLSPDSYVLGGRTYFQYRSLLNNKCLSHTSDLLVTIPCVWGDNSQWWAAEWVHLGYEPCPPSSPNCLPIPIDAQLLMPWDQSNTVATSSNGLLILTPRVGSLGSNAQHLHIFYQPAPPH